MREQVTNPVEEIVPTSLADEIAFRLQAAILDGVFPPGTHLYQDEICARFGVSRTPVREALRKLQAQHLVVVVPNKGAKVRIPGRQELIDVYAVRADLEGFACELAALVVGPETLGILDHAQAALDAAVERLEREPIERDDVAAFHARFAHANEEFHGAIHRAAGNQRLQKLILELQHYFPKDYVWRAQASSDEMRRLNIDQHVAIREALASRRPRGARKAMEEHIRLAGVLLVAYLDERDFWK